MKCKKLLSLAMAGVMSLSLAVPAFASGSTEITGTYAQPDIDVVVTPSAAAFINPLGLEIEVDTTNHLSVGGQILSAPMTIKNQSAMDLQVDASMTVTVKNGSTMRFVTTSTGGTGATKTVFAYLQAKQEPTLVGAESAITGAAIATAFGNWAASPYSSATDLVVNGTMASTKSNLVTVRAAQTTGGTFTAYKAGSIALVRLAGDCVAVPSTEAWVPTVDDNGDANTNGDGFTINVAYTFTTASIDKYDVTVSAPTYAGTITTGASVSASEVKAAAGDTVTLNVTSPAGAELTISATTPKTGGGTDPVALTGDPAKTQTVVAASNAIKVLGVKNGETMDGTSGPAATTTTITFTMPAGGVTITAAVADR